MTDHNDFDRTLAGWFEADAHSPAPGGGLDRVLDATSHRRPRPVWLAGLGSRWVGEANHARQSFRWRVAAAIVLGLCVAGGMLFLLQPRQAAVGNPSEEPSPSSSIAEPTAALWTATASLPTPHYGHTATLLPDGKVLVAGGLIGNGGTAAAWLYDPNSGTWTATGNMVAPRVFAAATLLRNGKVLVAGGGATVSGADSTSAELYDPSIGTWTATGNMVRSHSLATATLLPNGEVLVAGGVTSTKQDANGGVATAELYNPDTGSWTATGNMVTPRYVHTATLLADGKVLVAGGYDDTFAATSNGTPKAVASAELYDPATGSWTATGSMATPRVGQTATLLPDGKVLVAGSGGGEATIAELYDPATGSWTATGSTPGPVVTAALLPDGTVLVAFLGRDAELYDPSTGSWTSTASGSTDVGIGTTATLLPDGTVLEVGGEGPGVDYASAELYHPAPPETSPGSPAATPAPTPMSSPGSSIPTEAQSPPPGLGSRLP